VVLSGRNASAPHFFSRGGNVIEHKDRDGRPVSSASKVRAERFFHREKEGGAKALSEYEAKQESTRLLTAKLRAERLAREAARAKPAPDPRKAAET
jgi:hypothetical protein